MVTCCPGRHFWGQVPYPAPEAAAVQRAQAGSGKSRVPAEQEMPAGNERLCCNPAEKQSEQRRSPPARGSEEWGVCRRVSAPCVRREED